MEVAAQSPPLFLACRHKAFPCSLDVGRQPYAMRRNTYMAGQVVEQAKVGGRERLVGRAPRADQLADHLLLVGKR